MIIKFFQIYCDAKDCVDHFPLPCPTDAIEETQTELRHRARQQGGWARIHGHDYCPKHVEDLRKRRLELLKLARMPIEVKS